MLGGWNPDQVFASWMVGAKRRHRGIARPIGRYQSPRKCLRRWGLLPRTAGIRRMPTSSADHRPPRPALGKPQFLVQAVSGGARDSPLHQRDSSVAGGSGPIRSGTSMSSKHHSSSASFTREPAGKIRQPDSHGGEPPRYSLAGNIMAALEDKRRRDQNPEIWHWRSVHH